jgi:ABC-2 type transport system permease protein
MRVKATIIAGLKAICSQWKQVLLIYVVFPLILTSFMGYVAKEAYRPETNFKKIDVSIIDKDNSESSKSFKKLFYSEGVKELFNVTDKGKYVITIPEGYESNLINLKQNTILVNEKERVSDSNETIIKAIINQYGKSLTETMIISDNIKKLNVKDKEKLFNDVTAAISKLSSVSALKENMIKGQRTLTSFENEAASIITYILFMIILSCVGAYHLDKENGSFKRLISTPITRVTFFNLDMVSFCMTSFIYGVLYVLTMRIAGYGFIGVNPIILLIIIIAQSLLASSLAGLLIAFFSKQTANTAVVILMYFDIIFGGAFIPVKEFPSKALISLSRFTPGKVITQAYKNCILFNSFDKIWSYVLIMIIISAAAYSISLLKVKLRWEE